MNDTLNSWGREGQVRWKENKIIRNCLNNEIVVEKLDFYHAKDQWVHSCNKRPVSQVDWSLEFWQPREKLANIENTVKTRVNKNIDKYFVFSINFWVTRDLEVCCCSKSYIFCRRLNQHRAEKLIDCVNKNVINLIYLWTAKVFWQENPWYAEV